MSDERMKKGVRRRTDEEVYEAALEDPDNPPLTEDELKRLSQNIPNIRYVRRKLKMSRTAFARAFGLPAKSVRDWEEGRHVPDPASQSLLRIIAQDPEGVLSLAAKARLAPA